MAYQRTAVAVVVLMLACLPLDGAVDHLVGGERGWSLGADYNAWAQSRQFQVGDRLVFKYQRGDHNVIKVDEAGFRDCTATATSEVLETGKDVITLSTPGRKWYICGVPSHCSVANQKLEINVLPRQAQAPGSSTIYDSSPPPSSSRSSGVLAASYAVAAATTSIAVMVMI